MTSTHTRGDVYSIQPYVIQKNASNLRKIVSFLGELRFPLVKHTLNFVFDINTSLMLYNKGITIYYIYIHVPAILILYIYYSTFQCLLIVIII